MSNVPPIPPSDEYLTLEQAARICNCHRNTVRRWANQDRLKTWKHGGLRRTTMSAIQQMWGKPVTGPQSGAPRTPNVERELRKMIE